MSIIKPSRWQRPEIGTILDDDECEALYRNGERVRGPQHSGCERLKSRTVQTSARPGPGFIARLLQEIRARYGDALARERRCVEEDARRLGGRVVWDDTN